MELYKNFSNYLTEENKEKAVEFILDKLSKEELDVLTLYEKILTPSLNHLSFAGEREEERIWREHIRSSIVRTIIECSYPYILRERHSRRINKKVIVSCPTEEYHEIGARMVADYFIMAGYETVFIGANTPKESLIHAMNTIKPDYLALSVTNYYHLFAAKNTIEHIKANTNYIFKVLVGGNAFERDLLSYRNIGADLLLHNFQDIEKLAEEDEDETRL